MPVPHRHAFARAIVRAADQVMSGKQGVRETEAVGPLGRAQA